MKNLLIVYNESISAEDFKSKNSHLIEVAQKNGFGVTLKSNADIYTFLNTNAVKSFNGNLNYDCCLFFDHDPYLAKNLELLGMKVINNSKALLLCENKASMYQEMVANQISVPKTFILPEQKEFNINGLKTFIDEAINQLSLPLIIKEWYGSMGDGVYLVKTRQDVYAVIEKFKGKNILLQEFIAEATGSDIRLMVIKDKVVTAVRRQAVAGNFRSNTAQGGTLSAYIPTVVETKLAINATRAVGCDFAVVDMLKSITGSLICEVNSTSNINKFYETTGVDVAEVLIKECVKKAK